MSKKRAWIPRRAEVDGLGDALAALLEETTEVSPGGLTTMVDVAGRILGATSARLLVADYGLTSLQALGEDGPTSDRRPIEGTLAGRAFTGGRSSCRATIRPWSWCR